MNNKLYAPGDFWNHKDQNTCTYKKLTNGCGSTGMKKGWKQELFSLFQPNTLFGLNIKIACDIHDWFYTFSEFEGIEGKNSADRVFLNNMTRLINKNTYWSFLKPIRRGKALAYYKLVVHFGGPAYAHGQKQRETIEQQKEKVA